METLPSNDGRDDASTPSARERPWTRFKKFKRRVHQRLATYHGRIPYLRKLPLRAILMIVLLIFVNLLVWAVCGLILSSHTHLLSTAALAYTLGLRHALDADHISAIDLMTRRLIATGQRPVTVGTFFSLGHSTIVVITSIVVAATAAGIAGRFDSFGTVGGIIGTSVSAVFLILLGIMNAYILYKLVVQIKKVIRMQPDQEAAEAWKIEGGGCFFRVLKRMFKLIDRPWKMYPLGVLFGMGFDTSSEIALLGISSIQGAKGTSIWLILVFPVLFTAGMCLVDTIDGALMMSIYVAPMGMGGDDNKDVPESQGATQQYHDEETATTTEEPLILNDIERTGPFPNPYQQPHPAAAALSPPTPQTSSEPTARVKEPLTFLYYSIVLTTLTVMCAIIIGLVQLLTLVLNVAHPHGKFWDGVATAGDYYEVIGGSICGSFVIFGGLSVLCYKPWRRWVGRERERMKVNRDVGRDRVVNGGGREIFDVAENTGDGGVFVREEELVEVDAKGSSVQRERVGGKAFDGPAASASVRPVGSVTGTGAGPAGPS